MQKVKTRNAFTNIKEISTAKSKLLHANHKSFISKALRKAIILRSDMGNLYFENRIYHSLINYYKQTNLLQQILQRREKINKLKTSYVSDNKFWKTIKT